MAEQCVAMCDFEGGPGELTFAKGDRITVMAKGGDAGYWEGVINQGSQSTEQSGAFPSCMVTSNLHRNKEDIFTNKAVALYDYLPKDSLEMALSKGDVVTVVGQHESSSGWWCGINESALVRTGKQGSIAPNFKGPQGNSSGSANNRSAPAAATTAPLPPGFTTAAGLVIPPGLGASDDDVKIFPSNFVSSKCVMALFPFQGRHSHELSFQVKDVILLHRRWNDGWWEGTLKGKRGIFPSNYTAPNASTLSPPFFCNKCKTVFTPGSRCKECARNEEITQSMLQALEDHHSGGLEDVVGSATGGAGTGGVDLFAYVDVDPSKGKGSLLTLADTLDKNTIGPKN